MRPTAQQVKDAAVDHFGIPKEAMTSHDRRRAWAYPRQIAMTVCRDECDLSLPQIGLRFGGRDHTTIRYAVDQIKGRSETYSEVSHDLDVVRALAKNMARPVEFHSIHAEPIFKSTRSKKEI